MDISAIKQEKQIPLEQLSIWQRTGRAAAAMLALTGGAILMPENASAGTTTGYERGAMTVSDGNQQSLEVHVLCDDRNDLTPNLTSVYVVNNSKNNATVQGTIKVGDKVEEVRNLEPTFNHYQAINFPTLANNLDVTVSMTSPNNASNTIKTGCNRDASKPLPNDGYWMVDEGGATYTFGLANDYDNVTSLEKTRDIESLTSTKGYWLVNNVGAVAARGAAIKYGERPSLSSGEEVTSLSRTPSDKGYWMFTTKGRVIPYGDAKFFGDMSGTKLNGPVLDSIPTPSGDGYYMVASDGGVFTFGDAEFAGSMGDKKLNAPVQSLVPDPDRKGYWLVASDGGIFSFDTGFYGSMGATRLNKPVTGMVGFPKGYMMVGEDGGIFTFGDAKFRGSMGDLPPFFPVVAVSAFDNQN